MKIPYKDRQLRTFYYCNLDDKYHYIFQVNGIDGNNFPSINKFPGEGEWCNVSTSNSFKDDWRGGKDKEMRLATQEEIELIRSLDTKGLLIETKLEYSIY